MSKRARLSRSDKMIANFFLTSRIFVRVLKFLALNLSSKSSFISVVMSLLSSSDEQIFESFENLFLRVNEHAASQDYAVILLRIKKFKLDVKRKAWIICDRDDRMRAAREKERRHIISRCIECFFSLVAKRMNDSDDNSWSLKMINDQHNHSFTLVDAHSVQRKIALTSEIRNDIAKQLRVQTKSFQILSSLRIFDLIDSSSSDSENSVVINSLFKSRDIYNLKAKLRREFLESLTSIQTLIRELNEQIKRTRCRRMLIIT
jgi:hypothetical protein